MDHFRDFTLLSEMCENLQKTHIRYQNYYYQLHTVFTNVLLHEINLITIERDLLRSHE